MLSVSSKNLEEFNAQVTMFLPVLAGEVGDVQYIAEGCRESVRTFTDGKLANRPKIIIKSDEPLARGQVTKPMARALRY